MNHHHGPRLGLVLAGVAFVGGLLVGSASAQLTAEEEVRVDLANGLENRFGILSEIDDGRFLVLWSGRSDGGSTTEVLARQFRSDGAPVDEPFVVASSTSIPLGASDITRTAAGELVVTWVATTSSGGGYDTRSGVKARRIDAEGTLLGEEIDVVPIESGKVRFHSRTDADDTGSFVVVWGESNAPLPYLVAINGRRFGPDGDPVGDEFQVRAGDSLDGGIGYFERVDGLHLDVEAEGTFLVVWSVCFFCGVDEEDDWVIAGRNVSADNLPEAPFEISGRFENLGRAAVARGEDSDFFAAWRDYEGLNGRRLDRSGTPAGGEFPIHPEVIFDPELEIATTPQGEMVAVWVEQGEVRGQRLSGSGEPLGEAFQVNSSTAGLQERPNVEADTSGFVVSWTRSNPPEPDEEGIYLRRFWLGRIFADGFESGDTSAWVEGTFP